MSLSASWEPGEITGLFSRRTFLFNRGGVKVKRILKECVRVKTERTGPALLPTLPLGGCHVGKTNPHFAVKNEGAESMVEEVVLRFL
jgi:hypothetical protein